VSGHSFSDIARRAIANVLHQNDPPNRSRGGGAVRSALKWWAHNLVAHPLLVLCPPIGRWLHAVTEPRRGAL
jgi:hypothetical protein